MLLAKLATLALLLAGTRALMIELRPDEPACFLRSVEAAEAVSILYELNTPELMTRTRKSSSRPMPGTLKVFDVQNQTVMDTPVTGKGEVLFTPAEQGNYTICFYSSEDFNQYNQRGQRHQGPDRLRFSFRGHSEREMEEEQLQQSTVSLSIRRLANRASSIRSQQSQIEGKYDKFGERVAFSAATMSVMSILIIALYIGLTTWQVRTLKRYFVRQKI